VPSNGWSPKRLGNPVAVLKSSKIKRFRPA
jgi:hypothetical protein